MILRFNLLTNNKDIKCYDYLEKGKKFYREQISKYQNHSNIIKIIDDNGIYNALDIMNKWFPKTDANVFLSHSHKDIEMVQYIAGVLLSKGYIPFIDSCYWGYVDTLLKRLDDKFCLDDAQKYYNYEKRNGTTTHVHLMLMNRLIETMNDCEALIFVNSQNSTKYNKGGSEKITDSAWIYSELLVSEFLRGPKDKNINLSKNISESYNQDIRIHYPVDWSKLVNIGINDLQALNSEISWKDMYQKGIKSESR